MCLAFLDLKAVFDSLLRKNVPEDLFTAIHSTYHEAKRFISINGNELEPFCMDREDQHGDSLRPLIFINFVDEIHKICKSRMVPTLIGRWNIRPVLILSLLYAYDIVLLADTKDKVTNPCGMTRRALAEGYANQYLNE